jgi:hypothetical protein
MGGKMPKAGSLALITMLTAMGGGLAPLPATAESEHTTQTPVVVTIPQRAQFPMSAVLPIVSATGAITPLSLAREAQKELNRVGCYEGEISGIWTPPSRLAAQRFVDRVNAKLPIDKPDEVLLALLRDQSGLVCGQCQRDQALDAAGRCMPMALVNRTTRPRSTATEAASDTLPPEQPPLDQVQAVPGRDNAGVSRRSQNPTSSGSTKSWQSLIRKVDRALGLY